LGNKTVDPRLRALAHPQRLRILAMVTAHPVSAAEVSAAIGIAHAAASYHLRQLAAAGLIRVAPIPARHHARGRPQRRYQMREDAFRGLRRPGMRLLDRALLAELDRRLRETGTARTVTDVEVWLPASEWTRLRRSLRQVDAIVHKRSSAPQAAGAKHVSVTTLVVEHRR
jgi:predicted ArsR family transcriptional regulator